MELLKKGLHEILGVEYGRLMRWTFCAPPHKNQNGLIPQELETLGVSRDRNLIILIPYCIEKIPQNVAA